MRLDDGTVVKVREEKGGEVRRSPNLKGWAQSTKLDTKGEEVRRGSYLKVSILFP